MVENDGVANMLNRANLMKGNIGLYQKRNDEVVEAGERNFDQILNDASDRMGQARIMMSEHKEKLKR